MVGCKPTFLTERNIKNHYKIINNGKKNIERKQIMTLVTHLQPNTIDNEKQTKTFQGTKNTSVCKKIINCITEMTSKLVRN